MAKDIYHYVVKEALIKEGWTITDDPLVLLSKAEGGLETDLGAEKVITAEKGLQKIAVEVKSFLQPSIMYELHKAFGQYLFYAVALEMKENTRILYLAIPVEIYLRLHQKEIFRRTIKQYQVKLIIFDPETKIIESWKEE